ncbi:hypothetical protein E3N88_38735 [Mikania micrantha]|uniref:Uncharacterized protein n=1 Tax=Mikania micrantha TaxID=192012 RepID=A0A5N6LUU2_9ASTR|nr:hypothetical protein E3N88_38735 [Mikania micrantha]
MSSWFATQIQFEYRKRWVNFKPQQPERYHQPENDANTQRHKVILKWLPPNVMKKIPLRKMLMVQCKENTWDTIRIFDPMWLTNLSLEDVKTLYRCQILFEIGDMEQALQFKRVIGHASRLIFMSAMTEKLFQKSF